MLSKIKLSGSSIFICAAILIAIAVIFFERYGFHITNPANAQISYVDCGLRIKDGAGNTQTFSCEQPGSVNSPLRIYNNITNGNGIYGIALVDTSDICASPVRIKTSNSGIKALRSFGGVGWASAGIVDTGTDFYTTALGTFGNKVYAGTGEGSYYKNARVYVYNGDGTWTKIAQFDDQKAVTALYDGTDDPGGFLWIGTNGRCYYTGISIDYCDGNQFNIKTNGGLYRYRADYNGGAPEKVFDFNFPFGFGTLGIYHEVYDVEFFNNRFYIATGGTSGARIYRSSDNTGDRDKWNSTPVLNPANTYQFNNLYISSDGKLYATTGMNNGTKAKLYVTSDGSSWSEVVGFSTVSNYQYITGIMEYNGKMYVSVRQKLNYSPGGTIYVFDGANWSDLRTAYPTLPDIGYGDLVVFDNGTGEKLYIGDGNDIRTFDGSNIAIDETLGDLTYYVIVNEDENKIYTGGTNVYYNPPCR